MAELLLFRWDHGTQSVPTPTPQQLAGLPSQFDLIDFRPDGWTWGNEELTNPWFRILVWGGAADADLLMLVSPQLPQFAASVQTTVQQYRGFHLNLADVRVSPALLAWWQDDTRAQTKFTWPSASVLGVTDLKIARIPVPVAASVSLG